MGVIVVLLLFAFVRLGKSELPLGTIYQRVGGNARGCYFTNFSGIIMRAPGSREWLCRGVNCIWGLHSRAARDFSRARPDCQENASELPVLRKFYKKLPIALLFFTFRFNNPLAPAPGQFFVTKLTF